MVFGTAPPASGSTVMLDTVFPLAGIIEKREEKPPGRNKNEDARLLGVYRRSTESRCRQALEARLRSYWEPAMAIRLHGGHGSRALTVFILAVAAGASGCAANYIRSAPPVVSPLPVGDVPISRTVVLVSIDGLRPDAIEAYEAPTLQRLIREGSYTLSARTIYPSKTLPSHTSMLTGQPPERHGVMWNNVITADADSIELPNVFSVARAHGYSTAAFFSKPKFQPLQRVRSEEHT